MFPLSHFFASADIQTPNAILSMTNISPTNKSWFSKMLNTQTMSVYSSWLSQICTYIPHSQIISTPHSKKTTVTHLGCYYTATMVLQLSSGRDTGRKSSRIAPTFLIHPLLYQPQWTVKRLHIKGFLAFGSSMYPGKARYGGKKMMWCCFCGGTQTLQKNTIRRKWRTALSKWSSGGKVSHVSVWLI